MLNICREIPSNNPGRVILFSIFLFLFLSAPAVHSAPHAPMLPEIYDGEDVGGWLMSEKLDGVRGYWDGRHLRSKNGRLFSPPEEFIHTLPPFPLEGELWGGRGSYEKTLSTVLKQSPHEGWRELKFAIFDVPDVRGKFLRRIEKARRWFAAYPSKYAFVIPQLPVRNRVHLEEELRRVEKLGGEGLIVRRPDAPYVSGRTADILKVKSHKDAEAVVLEHLPGEGRNREVMGSLLVELPNGVRFRVGSGFSDKERKEPPPIGATITFKHYGTYASGIPRFPSFLRIRHDSDL